MNKNPKSIFDAETIIVVSQEEAEKMVFWEWVARHFFKLFFVCMALLAVAYFGMKYLDQQEKRTDPLSYYKENPVEALKDGYKPTEAELTARYGPKTEVTADGQLCSSGRCPGGYATMEDYHKANDAKDAEFAAEYERQRQARYNALHANDQ
jgi:hypothetical protein